MNLLLIRHGPAGERSAWERTGHADAERPLTVEGRELMRLATPGIAALVPRIDVLATSPLTRAYQTAEIVSMGYAGMPITVVDSLAPGGDRTELLEWIREHRPGLTIALVGHNPDLESLIAWLLAVRQHGFVRLRKGGAAMISFDVTPSPGGGILQWLLTPEQLIGAVRAS
jgi:phosphohistidine phosphatase